MDALPRITPATGAIVVLQYWERGERPPPAWSAARVTGWPFGREGRGVMEMHTVTWDPNRGWSGPLPECDSPATLVLAFGSSEVFHDQGVLREVLDAYPTSAVIGCSTAGEIVADRFYTDCLTVAVAKFGSTRISVVCERVAEPGQSYSVGLSLAKRLMNREPALGSLFVLSDGLSVNGSALVAGLVEGTGPAVTITGGLAGDSERFERTWILADGKVRSRYVAVVGLAGPHLVVGHGSRGGWDIFGPQRLVTRSDGNVLYELDGQPALRLYKKYLGGRAAGLPATALLFPLAVRIPGADERRLVRTILAIDEQTQSMTFAGDIPEGSRAQLMRANLDRLVDGAHLAGLDTASDPACAPLAVAVSCVGRRLLLGRRTEDEIDAVLSALPHGTQLIGFYSYGEIAPIATGTCDLHNQTMTITTFWESAQEDG